MFESSLSLFLNFCFLHDLFRFFSVSNTLRQQGVANSELLTFETLSSAGGEGGGRHQPTRQHICLRKLELKNMKYTIKTYVKQKVPGITIMRTYTFCFVILQRNVYIWTKREGVNMREISVVIALGRGMVGGQFPL